MYAEAHPEIIEAQIDWIVANEVAESIIYVAHLGDLKDDLSCDNKMITEGTGGNRFEWGIVSDAFTDLDTANIPYGVVPGNHDFDSLNPGLPGETCPNFTTERPLTLYNTNFGPARFAGDPWYGDISVPTPGNRVSMSNEDNFTLFESDGVKFIAINLAYHQIENPMGMDPEVTWADGLMTTYSDRLAIVTSHYFLDKNPGNNFGDYGVEIYNALSSHRNFFMMLSAHEFGEAWRVETTGRGSFPPVHALLSDYQRMVFPDDPSNPVDTPPCCPDQAFINFATLGQTGFGDSGFMRIMRFDTATGMVNIDTFIPPEPVIKMRPGMPGTDTLVSTHVATSGADMGETTASKLSIDYTGYVPLEIVNCGVDTTGGDLLDRGWYHPSYPGSTLESVEVYLSSRDAGSHTVRLDARLNAYDGALIDSDSQTRTLSGIDTDNVSFLYDMGGAAVTPGSTVTFELVLVSGPGTQQVFAAADAALHPLGGGGTAGCDINVTDGTTPPLDTLRRDGMWIRIRGLP
jgi:hypothetical protein